MTASKPDHGRELPGLWSLLPAAHDVMLEDPSALKLAYRWRDRGPRYSALGRAGLFTVIPVMGLLDEAAIAELREALDDVEPGLGGVVFEIDSPGGMVDGVRELGDRVRSLRQRCRVVSVVTGVAAGSAFWLAAQASAVVASPSAQLGGFAVQGGTEAERREFVGGLLADMLRGRGGISLRERDLAELHPARKAALIGLATRVATLDETIRVLARERRSWKRMEVAYA